MMRSLLVATMLVLGLAANSNTNAAGGDMPHASSFGQELDRILADAAAEGFNGALIVEQDGEFLFAKGYGYADHSTQTPFTVDTVAQIGSITKTFTATLAASLIADGRIDPASRYRDYVPDAPEPIASATINDLLTHHSGLRDYCGDDFEALSGTDFLQQCLSAPLAHKTGEPNYANAGYSAIALLLERITGKSWNELLASQITGPLGMTSAGFYFSADETLPFAHGYLDDAEQPVISQSIAGLKGDDWNLRGNGGMQVSARDMIVFMRAITAEPCGFANAACSILQQPHAAAVDGVAEGYGLFFRYDDDGHLTRAGHAGSDGVFLSYAAWYPARDLRFYFVGSNGEDRVRPVLIDVIRRIAQQPDA